MEGWRGEVCHVALTDARGRFRTYKIVDPSFHNWTGLALAMRGQADLGLSALQQELQPLLLRIRSLSGAVPMFVIDTILYRLRRGCETMAYPDGPAPPLPDRHGGALRVDAAEVCRRLRAPACAVCPTEAITPRPAQPVALDLGRCIFCAACVEACPTGAITQTGDHRMAVRAREDLVLGAPGERRGAAGGRPRREAARRCSAGRCGCGR